jgi:2-polyprenyl-3-methyl-5-hydroxy-6-metoxy-1,4-benzoquinol methylase
METKALAERLFRNTAGALELFAVYLGDRLGLYRALAGGSATSTELAARTGIAERYAREWLEHHAAAGLLEVDDPRAESGARRFTLPPEHVPVLADPDDPDHRAFAGAEIVRAGRRMAEIVEAFRTGAAPPPLPWGPEGRAEPNRGRFVALLGREWLPAITDVDARLRADPPARVADIACGTGWSSIAMALAYPRITVDAFDLDDRAVTAAREHAADSGVADRVHFAATDVTRLDAAHRYDLITIIEALHDMTRPVEALRQIRGLLTGTGSVLVVDNRVEDEFTAPAPEQDQHEYGWSLVACLADAMGDPGTAATGAVMRPPTLRRYATEAGYSTVELLPITTDYWNFYRLTP